MKKWVIADYFEGLEGVAAANGTTYGFVLDADDATVLVSNNQKQSSSKATLTLTFDRTMLLTFQYKVSSEANYDKLTIVHNTEALATESGTSGSWKDCTVYVADGDTITFTYSKDSSGDRGDDTAWLKNFSTQALRTVTFNGLPEGAELVVKSGDAVQTAQSDGTYLLPAGNYTYSVTAPGYKNLTDQAFTVADADMTIPVSMQHSSFTFEKAFENVKDYLTAANDETAPFGAFETDAGGYLQSSNNTNGTDSAITLTFTKPAHLSFKYWVSESGSIEIDGTKYGLVVKKGDEIVFSKDGISESWQTCELDVNAGETVTIHYSCFVNGNEMSAMDENFLRLKNFTATALCAVNFTDLPEGATLLVKSGDTVLSPYSGSTYLLTAGEYTYSVTAFGYTDKNGTVTVAAGDTSKDVSAALTALATKTIRFSVDPADAAISVSHATAGDMSAFRQDDGSYKLPENESYSYIVSKDGYVERRGVFVADGDKTVTVPTLDFCGEAWDGTTKTEPAQKDGVYQISNAAELAWFADAVNGGQTAINAQLTANINLGGKDWTSIGAYDKQYTGRFDGNYKTISGLKGENGLFEYVGAGGYVGAVAVGGTISGSGNLGGIVGTNYGTIENCLFKGSLTVSLQYAMSAGGIAGRSQSATSVIRGCVNLGSIHNACTSYAQDLKTGGIVGYTYGTVESCYNMGQISAVLSGANGTLTSNGIGGVIGIAYSGSTVRNVYNAGSVTGPSTAQGTPGAIIGTNNSTDVTNAWYLTGTADKAAGKGTAINNAEKTAEIMQSDRFAFDLGNAFRVDSDGINSGYPVLAWQGGREPVISDDNDAVELAAAALVLKKADGTALTADEDGKYQLREELTLLLAATGDHNTTITWSASPAGYVDLTTGKVTLPASGNPQVILTATVTRGEKSAQKQFTLSIWSSAAAAQKLLDGIKTAATADGVFIQPLEVYGHSNIVAAMEQYLMRNDHPVKWGRVTEGIEVTLVSSGTKLSPSTDSVNLAANGDITYYTDIDAAENYATYENVTFKLKLGEAEVDVPMTVHIGWSEEFADDYMLNAAKSITWDMIRGQNENSSTTIGGTDSDAEWWETVKVDGSVSENLLLPLSLSAYPAVTVAWMSKTTSAMKVQDNGDGTYTGVLNRPVYGQPDLAFLLTARVTFNRVDDYMKEELAQEGGSYESNCYEIKNFDMKIAARTDDDGKVIYDALAKYPTLLRDFVDKTQTVDCDHITADLQMPVTSTLEAEGIIDRDTMRVQMTSQTPDVLEFTGYHALVYRPLPGGQPVTATYTISIYDRPSGVLLTSRDFTITIDPLTQQEIDDAKAFMDLVSTDAVYWEGIKNANTGKDNVTRDLDSFVEIVSDGNGGYTFVRGMVNKTFAGVEVAELPGYDDMGTQPWRLFRSSRTGIITCENLLVTQPEYDTQVKIDSVLTHYNMAKYWIKFQNDPAYAQFEQFYKRPVSATVTVKGTVGEVNPNPVQNISVTVSVDGGGFENFRNASDYTFEKPGDMDWTAWDAVSAFFAAKGYSYKGGGNYVSAITDPNGVELAELEHGENSGWMYRVNGELPDQLLSQYILKNGDKIELFYTGDYKTVPGVHGEEKDEAVKNVESLISAIGTVTEKSAEKLDAARDAYEKLTDAQKKQVSNYEELTRAEAAFNELNGGVPFTDVKDHWGLPGIRFAYEKGLMNGVGGRTFDPDGTLNRAMVATMLYRLAGEPETAAASAFTDVPAGEWYAKAVAWASENGVVNGVGGGKFDPLASITREQLAAMLYRYAQYKKYDVSVGEDTNILSYDDVQEISAYAVPAMQWACGAGLIQGRTVRTIVPQGTATRAEAATIFLRLQENVIR